MNIENAIVVRSKTRLEELTERFNTQLQAKFYIERMGGNFEFYVLEHDTFYKSLEKVIHQLTPLLKVKILFRPYLPSYLFSKEKDVVVVLGQDGLVANTAKYANDIPVVAINPDISRNDGILLPFHPENFIVAIKGILNKEYKYSQVTMAQAKLNDGQRLLAFNDLFIGPSSHISARYRIAINNQTEMQSSSGIIISTGVGATGWLSSLFNMANGIARVFDLKQHVGIKLEWDDPKLVYIVREPFLSKTSNITLAGGFITENVTLNIESLMPFNGKIFSDGIETDSLEFNTGSIAEVTIAKEKAKLVVA